MNREDLNITLQSKKEYIDQFINLTLHQFVEGFKSIYENVKNNNSVPKLILKEFQDQLKLIPLWSQNMIDEEYKRIKLMSKCEYLDDLIQAMFASYSQILLADNKSYDNLNVSIPTPTHVIHSCYITIARSIWKKPGILYHRNNNTTLTNNLTLLNQVITDDINSTIRNLLPFKEILENYLEQNNKNTEIEENLTDSIGNVDINSINETDVIDEGEDIENYEVVEDTEYEEGVVEDAVEDGEYEEGVVEDAVEDVEYEEGVVEDAVEDVEYEEGVVEGVVEDVVEVAVEEVAEDVIEVDEGVVEDAVEEVAEDVIEVDEGVVENAVEAEEVVEDVVEVKENVIDDEQDSVRPVAVESQVIENIVENVVEDVVEDSVTPVEVDKQVVEGLVEDVKVLQDNNKIIDDYEIIDNEEVNDYYNQNDINDSMNDEDKSTNEVKQIVLVDKNKKNTKKKSSQKIQRYLGVNMSPKDFKKNKSDIKKMLLHKNVLQ